LVLTGVPSTSRIFVWDMPSRTPAIPFWGRMKA
jgi:hypothetical protein